MKRRLFLQYGTGAGLSALMWGCGGGSGGEDAHMFSPSGSGAANIPAGQSLVNLPKLQNLTLAPGQFEATLVAAPSPVMLVPARTTEAWLYNGQFPGPAIEVTEGDRVRIRLENRLASQATSLQLHHDFQQVIVLYMCLLSLGGNNASCCSGARRCRP